MKYAARLIAAGFALIAGVVFALPEDRNQPIEIQANTAEHDAKTGVTTYTGNVDVQQGSIHIGASSVVLNSKDNKLTQIHATGGPATYHQQLTGPDDVVDARGSTIHFDVAKNLITLQGNASLKQSSGTITGDRIEYDTQAERVKARAAEAGSSDNSRRITVVIPPSSNNTAATSGNKKNNSQVKSEKKKQ